MRLAPRKCLSFLWAMQPIPHTSQLDQAQSLRWKMRLISHNHLQITPAREFRLFLTHIKPIALLKLQKSKMQQETQWSGLKKLSDIHTFLKSNLISLCLLEASVSLMKIFAYEIQLTYLNSINGLQPKLLLMQACLCQALI